ncbi:MAG TPA: penicillin-binding transpeptidase domain-containing protein, partial [Lysobacter sp.]|nr:penicillin-binding transpeptidase domain-containing protein [Lysobacter sp.]
AAPRQWSGTTKATMSYGYGLSATPLQIAVAYAAIANGGRVIAPTFVKGQRNEAQQAMGPVVSRQVLHAMQTVTETGGTATRAAILGYHVAGKTGTSRKFSSTGGYSKQYVALFAGVVPVENPRFSMVVVIDEPDASAGFGYGGGAVAAPVFKNVMEGTLRLMDVPPDDIETWLAAQAEARSKRIRANGGNPARNAPVLPEVAAVPVRSHGLPAPVPIGGAP